MAATSDAQNDMPAHNATYSGFVALLKWGTILSFLVGFGVVLLIAS